MTEIRVTWLSDADDARYVSLSLLTAASFLITDMRGFPVFPQCIFMYIKSVARYFRCASAWEDFQLQQGKLKSNIWNIY